MIVTALLLALSQQITVGIQLSALRLPETFSYRTFTSLLTEWLMTIQLTNFFSAIQATIQLLD